ncbi:MAG: glycosyltransferase family 1 protein [Anaerolinea sp.]|nr:glycosyltransferase family 1 protein [Anaerolinea sp.]
MGRIGLISEHASPLAALGGVDSGGQNVYVDELARHLGSMGCEVDVFTRWDDPRQPHIVTLEPNVRVIHIKAGAVAPLRKEDMLGVMGEFTADVLRFMRSEGYPYTLLHANFWMSALVAADIKRRIGLPFVVTYHALGKVRVQHQGSADQFPKARIDIETRTMREADGIIAECPQDFDDLVTLYGADPAKIAIIPCGVNMEQFHPVHQWTARTQLGLNPRERYILQLGRIVPRKGIDTVIAALGILTHHYDCTAHLLIVGGESDDPDPVKTPEIGRLMQIAEQERVAHRMTFTGRKRRDQLKYYYAAADVFVTTPWYEPFGMTPLESMACGTPVIGAAVGGVKYSVAHEVTGFLVPSKNPAALAERLHQVLADSAAAETMGENALRRANDLFAWSRVTEQVAAFYDAVIERQPTLSMEQAKVQS